MYFRKKNKINNKKKIDNWAEECFAEFGEFIKQSESLKRLYVV